MRKSLFIPLFILISKFAFSQEQISDVKYEFYDKRPSNISLSFQDSLINGFVFQDDSNISPPTYSFYKYLTNSKVNLDFSEIEDSLYLRDHKILSKDSVYLLLSDYRNNTYWVETDLKSGKSSLIKIIKLDPNKFISYSFYKKGIAFFENKALKIYEKGAHEARILIDVSQEISEDSALIGYSRNPNFQINYDTYSTVFKTKILINGVFYNLSEDLIKKQISNSIWWQSENSIIFLNSDFVLKFQEYNGVIKEVVNFAGKNIYYNNNGFYSTTSEPEIKYFQIIDNQIEFVDNPIFSFIYGDEIHTEILKIKLGYTPFTGGGFYNYVWAVDKRDNSYYDITSLSSFTWLTSNKKPIITIFKNETLIKTGYSNYEGFLIIKTNLKNLDFTGYQILRPITKSQYLVLTNDSKIGFFDSESLKFELLLDFEKNAERKLHNIDSKKYSNSFPIYVGDKSLLSFFSNTPLIFKYNLKDNLDTKKIYPYDFYQPFAIAEDTILPQKFDKMYTFSENKYSTDNVYTFVGKNFDSLFFYNNSTKITEWFLIKSKSNQYPLEINYLAKNEIQVINGPKLFAKKQKQLLEFNMPASGYYSSNYDPKSSTLFYLYNSNEKYINAISLQKTNLKQFIFEIDPKFTISNVPGYFFIKQNESKFIVDLKNENLIKSTLDNLGNQTLLHSNNDIYFYYKSNRNYPYSNLIYLENLKTNRYTNFNLGSANNFYFLFADNEYFYYQIYNSVTKQGIFRIDLKTFFIYKLDEEILNTDVYPPKLYIKKDKNIYFTSFRKPTFSINFNKFYPYYGYNKPTIGINSKENKYYIYSIIDNKSPQIYELKNDIKFYENIKWKYEDQLDNKELQRSDIFNLAIFPNPIEENFIKLKLSQPISKIEIFDLKGVPLLKKEIAIFKNSNDIIAGNKTTVENILMDFFKHQKLGTVIAKFTMEDNTVEIRKLFIP